MGASLSVSVTSDKGAIFDILKHPDIWPLVSKRKPSKHLIPTRPQDIYLLVKHGKRVIACVYFEVLNGYELEMHPYVLPEERKNHSYEAVKTCMDWAFNQQIKRILVQIPDEFPRVIAFALRMGFEDIGDNTLEMRLSKWAEL